MWEALLMSPIHSTIGHSDLIQPDQTENEEHLLLPYFDLLLRASEVI